MKHTAVKITFDARQISSLPFFIPHTKPRGLWGLSKHYHLFLDPKLCHVKCGILQIPSSYSAITNMLYKTWYPSVSHIKQPFYQTVVDCTHWPMLGSFGKYNIIQFTNKTTSSEESDDIHNVVIGFLSDNVLSLVQTGRYGAINKTFPTIIGYYVVKYMSVSFTLQ